MKDYILLILADLFLAANFAITKIYQKNAGTSFKAGFSFTALTGLFTALIFWVANGFKFACTVYSLMAAVLLALLGTSYTLLGFRIMKRQGMALYTLFLMTGGMTVPYLFGLLFLDESFSVLRTVGLVVIIAGVFFSSIGKEKLDRVSMLLCVAVFFLNGFVSVVSKLHSIEEGFATVKASEFVVLSGLINFGIAMLLRYLIRDQKPSEEGESTKISKQLLVLLVIPALSALIGGMSSILQLTGAKTLDASLLYPFITGGSIVFSALTGWLFFHEKPSRNRILSVILAFAGTLMFL